ncbi:hypothetical protein CC85DRAFT_154363 [Cutaneotrichosporon oleaginosum]|uniref:Uncharacterized protein n=1 Tax=Cutaneotrichosporon oleaginosum TaxID=879819 RepID=A0A0J0XW29_9TREE|nr:uncharacterized protein CC85DRAFT_154363 [Cutaneotrichosporon oleaginosum]KLT45276.1 hypothetical protein CC85DRAFT_154363 [Cutaneotrichosporon oleaginosum]TXT14895.1 hypothetical protein COLE_01088 [Cutaneotrichosporon oleaginosum]
MSEMTRQVSDAEVSCSPADSMKQRDEEVEATLFILSNSVVEWSSYNCGRVASWSRISRPPHTPCAFPQLSAHVATISLLQHHYHRSQSRPDASQSRRRARPISPARRSRRPRRTYQLSPPLRLCCHHPRLPPRHRVLHPHRTRAWLAGGGSAHAAQMAMEGQRSHDHDERGPIAPKQPWRDRVHYRPPHLTSPRRVPASSLHPITSANTQPAHRGHWRRQRGRSPSTAHWPPLVSRRAHSARRSERSTGDRGRTFQPST